MSVHMFYPFLKMCLLFLLSFDLFVYIWIQVLYQIHILLSFSQSVTWILTHLIIYIAVHNFFKYFNEIQLSFIFQESHFWCYV